VCALSIGSFVKIGDGAVVSARCILKDCCEIAPGAILPPDTVVPPFTYWSGVPARCTRELPDSTEARLTDYTSMLYKNFKLLEPPVSARSTPRSSMPRAPVAPAPAATSNATPTDK